MKQLWQYVRRYKGRWAWGFALLLLTNAVSMMVPQLFRYAIDGIREGFSLELLEALAVTLVVLALGGAVFRTLSRIHIFYAARDVEMDLRCVFYQHLARQPPSFYLQRPVGDLMSRATSDLQQVRLLLGPGLLNIVNTVVAYAQAIPLMALISGKLTLLTLAIYPAGLLAMRYIAWQLFRRTREQQQSAGRLADVVQESLAGAHVIRAFAREDLRQQQLDAGNEDYYQANLRLNWVRSVHFRLMLTVGNVGVLLAVYFGARDAIGGALTVGELVAMVEYMALLSWPTFALGWMLSIWQRGAASMWRLNEIMSIAPSIAPGEQKPAELPPSIEVRDFSLELGARRVLDGVNLSVPAGATLGIVGPIGGGKSLLAQALLRLVEVPQGHLFVGGYDVTTLDLDVLRRHFGFVPQVHTLFSKTVGENVAFGCPNAARSDILEALSNAAFVSDLDVLPQGLETPVGERGITLSGGQKQRLAIARALILKPPILVLDDALSSVDAETETQILEHLRAVRTERTTIIVAHRMTAVQHADEVVVMDSGRIVERGTHGTLMARDGLYAQMARRQQLQPERPPALDDERSWTPA